MVERAGLPLAVRLSGTYRNDSILFEVVVDAAPPTRLPNGHRRTRPVKLHADKAYDIPRCRTALTCRHIQVRIARMGIDSGARVGRHR